MTRRDEAHLDERDWRSFLTSGIERAQRGDSLGAKTSFLNALKASNQTGAPSVVLEALMYSGRALFEIGESELALSTLESAQRLATRLGDADARASTDRTLSELQGQGGATAIDALDPRRAVLNTRGEPLPMTVGMYDLKRPAGAKSVRTLCHAPFVSVDFGPQGQITVCNHYHKVIDRLGPDKTFLDIWRGEEYQKLRESMHDYVIDEERCRHCVRQIRAGDPLQTFAVLQYDAHPAEELKPHYPRFLTFRLSNRCNLACVMCDGSLSSRIRRERERKPPLDSAYDERFFEQMRAVLPQVEHIEFFGGEPLIVEEHRRIFDILEETGARCSIYVNTNGTSLNKQTKQTLERLNFKTIAISMDATIPEVHAGIRVGIQHDVFLRNLAWFLDLGKRRQIHLLLNVTEQRGNWFDLPELFRFAAAIGLFIHVNTCIHPPHCTLYTLPTVQLRFVHGYLERKRETLTEELKVCNNEQGYRHLLNLITSELASRSEDWSPPENWLPENPAVAGTDGRLPSPIPGYPPLETPDAALGEIRWMAKHSPGVARELFVGLSERLNQMPEGEGWERCLAAIDAHSA